MEKDSSNNGEEKEEIPEEEDINIIVSSAMESDIKVTLVGAEYIVVHPFILYLIWFLPFGEAYLN